MLAKRFEDILHKLLLMAIKLLIERNFIGLILFCVVLFLAFGVTPHTK